VENNYIFSAKDLCTLPFIEKLKKAGVSAFKIEGRGREPEYVDGVVRIYRKAIDKKLLKKRLKKVYLNLQNYIIKGFHLDFTLEFQQMMIFQRLKIALQLRQKNSLEK